MTTIKVAQIGGSGTTGLSIANALLESTDPKFEIHSLVRPASVDKPVNAALRRRGVKIVPTVLNGPEDDLVQLLHGIDVVISTIAPIALADEMLAANAAKRAGVKRFVPSAWATVIPPTGVMAVREMKGGVLHHILKIGLPYTFIDVGWWYQVTLPPVPSGRLDYCLPPVLRPSWVLGKDGSVPSALTHTDDIGKYVARIIADPRTLNRSVFAYGEVRTRSDVFDLLERVSDEKLKRTYVSEEEAYQRVADCKKALERNPEDFPSVMALGMAEYFLSWGIRGDNTPEYAKYLGYLDCKELYPDVKVTPFEDFVQQAVEGKVEPLLMDLGS